MQSGIMGVEATLLTHNFRPLNRQQQHLLPPSLTDWLPADDIAWFVLDAVGHMDLAPFYARYRKDGRGGMAFEPSMMVALLVYAYCMGERSSRRIARLCERDVAVRVVASNHTPDFVTIARFRRQNLDAFTALFGEVLKLCAAAGLAKVGTVALDGTKMKANAALDANRTHEGLSKEIARMMEEAEAEDVAEDGLFGADRRGDELPEDLRDRTSRLARLTEAIGLLEHTDGFLVYLVDDGLQLALNGGQLERLPAQFIDGLRAGIRLIQRSRELRSACEHPKCHSAITLARDEHFGELGPDGLGNQRSTPVHQNLARPSGGHDGITSCFGLLQARQRLHRGRSIRNHDLEQPGRRGYRHGHGEGALAIGRPAAEHLPRQRVLGRDIGVRQGDRSRGRPTNHTPHVDRLVESHAGTRRDQLALRYA